MRLDLGASGSVTLCHSGPRDGANLGGVGPQSRHLTSELGGGGRKGLSLRIGCPLDVCSRPGPPLCPTGNRRGDSGRGRQRHGLHACFPMSKGVRRVLRSRRRCRDVARGFEAHCDCWEKFVCFVSRRFVERTIKGAVTCVSRGWPSLTPCST